MPEKLADWRKARATLAHDWLERRMLPILITPASGQDDLNKRARLCLDAWNMDISPRIDQLSSLLPGCLLPGLLLRAWLNDRLTQQIDNRILDKYLTANIKLMDLGPEIMRFAAAVLDALKAFADMPVAERQSNAFESVLAFRTLLQELPRTIIFP